VELVEKLSAEGCVVGYADSGRSLLGTAKKALLGQEVLDVAALKLRGNGSVFGEGEEKGFEVRIMLVGFVEVTEERWVKGRNGSDCSYGGNGDVGASRKSVGDNVRAARAILEGDVEVCEEIAPAQDSAGGLGLSEDRREGCVVCFYNEREAV
jgi:hypothetical protein